MKGSITISHSGGAIHITIEDSASRIQFLKAKMTMEAFAQAITGLGYCDITFETRSLSLIGWTAENKTEVVEIPDVFGRFEDGKPLNEGACQIVTAVKRHEIDGWKARMPDAFNHHCRVKSESGKRLQRIVFFRHVPPAESTT